ncbi:MAG: hypothetical protein KGH56_01090 [Patescibacteria group bacterium]|nr:hypothetical protein [Patescibacteria group bacterium]
MQTVLNLTTVSVLCTVPLLVLIADLATDVHIATVRTAMRLCKETKECIGAYLVLTDDRVFRIDDGASTVYEPQVVSQDDMLSHEDNSAFLLNIKEIVLQKDRGNWLLYTDKRSEQIRKSRPLPLEKMANAN